MENRLTVLPDQLERAAAHFTEAARRLAEARQQLESIVGCGVGDAFGTDQEGRRAGQEYLECTHGLTSAIEANRQVVTGTSQGLRTNATAYQTIDERLADWFRSVGLEG